MNILDIIVLIVIGVFAYFGYRSGLIRMIYRLLAFVLAVILAVLLYIPIATLLRATPLFDWLKNGVISGMGLEQLELQAEMQGQNLFDILPLPAIVQDLLRVNDNPNMQLQLQANNVVEYIGGFIANMVLLGIALITVFILAFIILSIVGSALDVVGRLPVIRTFNDLGGFLLGLGLGVLVVGFALFIFNLLFSFSGDNPIASTVQGSFVARFIFDNIISGIFGITT